MDKHIFVYIDLNGTSHLVGELWSRRRNQHESATFKYDEEWLTNPNKFALEPALFLGLGSHHTPKEKVIFGAIGDSAPDRWGRMLMRRAARRKAEADGITVKSLQEIDFLLSVNDEARQGALRFSQMKGGPFLSDDDSIKIPPLLELPKLLSASDHVLNDKDSLDDLRLLLAPASSLGGARPKASIYDKESYLCIAKFPGNQDEYNVPAWEAVALSIAQKAGIEVPNWQIKKINNKDVLLVRRFDRINSQRIPFLSAMSMLGANDNETHSYLEIADAIRQYGSQPEEDLLRLWRRVLFNVLTSNTDDHLRNHAFLYDGATGWRLSPAYDLNPTPIDIKPRVLTIAIDEHDATASLEIVMRVASHMGINQKRAIEITRDVAKAISTWRHTASHLGLKKEIERMASAFEHDDLEKALKY